jgi:hypothetical protein
VHLPESRVIDSFDTRAKSWTGIGVYASYPREKFNNYRFARIKPAIIKLLCKVTTVSLRTQEIVELMAGISRGGWNNEGDSDE